VELLAQTNRLLEEQLETYMKSDPKSQWQAGSVGHSFPDCLLIVYRCTCT
jgi:hypothetical protein